MEDALSDQPKKLASNFVEEAGIRCFDTHEFKDWYEAIHAVLLESGIDLGTEVIKELFLSLPDEADDDIFELALKSYLIDKDLLSAAQVEGDDWNLLFLKSGEVAWVDERALGVLHADPTLKARLSTHEKVGGELQA